MEVKQIWWQGYVTYLKKILISQDFALLWSGQFISMIGDLTFKTAIVLWIATEIAREQSWAPLAVSGALLANYGPAFLLGPIAGVFVDRWNKYRVMLIVDILRAAFICLFSGLIAISSLLLAKGSEDIVLLMFLYGITFMLSMGDRFFNPALLAFIGDIIEENKREQAAGLNQVSQSLVMIVVPPLATLLFFSIGAQWLLIINAASFFISFTSLWFVHTPLKKYHPVEVERTKSWLHEFGSGLLYIVKKPGLLTLLLTTAISMFGAGALNVLDFFFLTQNLHAPQNLYGLLDMFFGIGLVVGALLSALFIRRIGRLRVFWWSQLWIGILIIMYSRMTAFLPAAVILFFLGWPMAALTVVSAPLVLQMVMRGFLGRVMSIVEILAALGLFIGSSLAGYLSSNLLYHFHSTLFAIHFSSIDTIILGAGVLIALSGCYARIRFSKEKLL